MVTSVCQLDCFSSLTWSPPFCASGYWSWICMKHSEWARQHSMFGLLSSATRIHQRAQNIAALPSKYLVYSLGSKSVFASQTDLLYCIYPCPRSQILSSRYVIVSPKVNWKPSISNAAISTVSLICCNFL